MKDASLKSLGSDRSSTGRRKVDDLNRLWNTVQEKSDHRQQELEEALKEVSHLAPECPFSKILIFILIQVVIDLYCVFNFFCFVQNVFNICLMSSFRDVNEVW